MRHPGRQTLVAALVFVVATLVGTAPTTAESPSDSSDVSLSPVEDAPEEALAPIARLEIFNRAILQIKDNYFDQALVEPPGIFVAAVETLGDYTPDSSIDADRAGSGSKVDLQLGDEQKSFEVGSLWEVSAQLKKVARFAQKQVDDRSAAEWRAVEYAMINAVLDTLDPNSIQLSPTQYSALQDRTRGKFGGTGLSVDRREGELVAIAAPEGTPAAEKGIEPGDVVVEIDGKPTSPRTVPACIDLLQGAAGTTVTLTLRHEGKESTFTRELTRDKVNFEPVDSRRLEDDIGYLRIRNFQADTASEVEEHLDSLEPEDEGLDGLFIDLLENPGGMLQQAVEVSDLFVDEGTLVTVTGSDDEGSDKKVASDGDEPEYPIVVLVDRHSAAGAEIVAAALGDNHRATLVGTPTVGNSTVQVVYEFPDKSALKLSVAEYMRPNGSPLRNGLNPDVRRESVDVSADTFDEFTD